MNVEPIVCKVCGKELPYYGVGKPRTYCGSCNVDKQQQRNTDYRRNRYQSDPEYQTRIQGIALKSRKKREAQGKISKADYLEVFFNARIAPDLYKCAYCNESFPARSIEVDHRQPLSKGGTNDLTNLVAACRACNRHKYNSTDRE